MFYTTFDLLKNQKMTKLAFCRFFEVVFRKMVLKNGRCLEKIGWFSGKRLEKMQFSRKNPFFVKQRNGNIFTFASRTTDIPERGNARVS